MLILCHGSRVAAGSRTPHTRVSNLPELGESELGSPHLTLAAEAVGADQLEPICTQKHRW